MLSEKNFGPPSNIGNFLHAANNVTFHLQQGKVKSGHLLVHNCMVCFRNSLSGKGDNPKHENIEAYLKHQQFKLVVIISMQFSDQQQKLLRLS